MAEMTAIVAGHERTPSSLIPLPCFPGHLLREAGIATLPRFLGIFATARLMESRAAVAIQSKSRQRFVPMLKLMRDSFQQLKWILVAIVAIFILFIFVDWGGGGTKRRRPAQH